MLLARFLAVAFWCVVGLPIWMIMIGLAFVGLFFNALANGISSDSDDTSETDSEFFQNVLWFYFKVIYSMAGVPRKEEDKTNPDVTFLFAASVAIFLVGGVLLGFVMLITSI